MHSKEQLKGELSRLGIVAGDTVLMHSSYKSLGGIEGGAQGFFEAFLELLGQEGTLVLPALSFDSVTREQPVFDLAASPSCVGYLSEFFRTSVPGVVRSMHATHSCCAVGKYAKELTEDHQLDLTPVGVHSPFAKLPHYHGKILMLGCSAKHITAMHGVEETAEPPYCIDRVHPVEYLLKDGDQTIRQTAYRHYFLTESGAHIKQRYDRILELLDKHELSHGYVLSAECYLMDAAAVWKKGHEKLLENPYYFVEIPQ